MIADGYQLLAELGALDEASKELTPVGRELAKLPLDPKIGRMILAAREHNCLREVLIMASALGTQDPRDRPAEASGSADQAHAKWKDEKSEFLSYLKIWQAADEVWKHETSNKQRQWCRHNFINWLRLREWRDVHAQLMTLCHEHGWKENQLPASYESIHKALLTGLLGHVGLIAEEDKNYLGTPGIRFHIHPGSSLVKKAGRWIVAAELVETSRLFARCIARIEPEWLEQVHMEDTKSYSFESMERGKIPAAEPLHSMWLRLTVDDSLTVPAIEAVTDYAPFPSICPKITEAYQQIVGLQIGPGWSRKIKERLGGVHGCTHLTELLGPAATTAFQTIFPRKSEKDMRKLALVNTCHAFDENGPLIKALETETLARETKP